MPAQGTLVAMAPADVPVQTPDARDRTDPNFLDHFHHEFCPDVAKHGVLVPLVVAITPDGRALLDGETRRRAALQVGLATVPVLLIEREVDPTELEIIKYRLNKKRAALSTMDEARFFIGVMQARGWTQSQLCREMNLRSPYVSKLLKTLSRLSARLLPHVGEGKGKLPLRAAYAICDLTEDQQADLAGRVMRDELCVEDAEVAAVRLKGKKAPPPAPRTFTQGDLCLTAAPSCTDATLIEWLTALIRQLRRGGSGGLTA